MHLSYNATRLFATCCSRLERVAGAGNSAIAACASAGLWVRALQLLRGSRAAGLADQTSVRPRAQEYFRVL